MKVHEVLPGLCIRGRFGRWPRERKLRELRELGISAVVCLTSRSDLDLMATRGICYVHASLSDGRTVNEDLVTRLAVLVATLVLSGGRVLVHCNAGRNRAGLVAALVVRELRGCSGAEALEYVRARRPRAVDNADFEGFLAALPAKE